MTIVRLEHKIITGDQSSTNLRYHSKDRLPKKSVSIQSNLLKLFNLNRFLLNHQCNEDYDEDDDSEFGNDSDGSVDKAKYLRHYEALQCNCSLHFTIEQNPNSPRIPGVIRKTQTIAELRKGEVTITVQTEMAE